MSRKTLTKVQKTTLKYLELGYTVGAIAYKRKVSPQAVYNTLRILDKKGYLKYGGKNWGGTNTLHKPIRLHSLQYQIKIIYSSPVYLRLLKNDNMLEFNDFKVRLYNKSLSLWILQDFTYSTSKLCREAAKEHLDSILRFLERKLSLTLLKRGYKNIRKVKSHYARVGDEIAKISNREGSKIEIKDPVDNKPWLITDRSFKIDELETVHPKTAYSDMHNIVEPLYNTLKEDPYFFDKLIKITLDTQKVVKDLAEKQLLTQNQILAQAKLLRGMFDNVPKPGKTPEPGDPEDPPDYFG